MVIWDDIQRHSRKHRLQKSLCVQCVNQCFLFDAHQGMFRGKLRFRRAQTFLNFASLNIDCERKLGAHFRNELYFQPATMLSCSCHLATLAMKHCIKLLLQLGLTRNIHMTKAWSGFRLVFK